MKRSRLSSTIEKKSKKQLYLSVVGIVVILFLLIKFGVPALINFSLFLGGFHTSSTGTTNNQTNSSPVLPPTLNQTFTATNSATISVSGTGVAKESIELFVNSELVSTQNTKDDGTFNFSNVALTDGINSIKARAKQSNKESNFSDPIQITFSNKQPTLTVDSPSDGESFSGGNNTITVSGKTDPDDKVTVNGFWAIVDDKGVYSYNLRLQNGDNQIKVIATDNAGNITEKDLKVNYSQ